MRGCEEGLELILVVKVKVIEVFNLIFVGLLFTLTRLRILLDDFFNLLLQALDILIVLFAGSLEIRDVLGHLVLALLSHQGLAHTVGN